MIQSYTCRLSIASVALIIALFLFLLSLYGFITVTKSLDMYVKLTNIVSSDNYRIHSYKPFFEGSHGLN